MDVRRSETDEYIPLALVHLVQIIGEAGARLSDEVTDAHPEIPWRQVVGMRNRVVHGFGPLGRRHRYHPRSCHDAAKPVGSDCVAVWAVWRERWCRDPASSRDAGCGVRRQD